MSVASRIAAVASEATPEVVELLLAAQVTTPYQGFEPPCVPMDVKRFQKLPAPQAEAAVPYLDEASVHAVFLRDKRKGVRDKLLAEGRISHELAPVVLAWMAAPDTENEFNFSAKVYHRVVARCSDELLEEYAGGRSWVASYCSQELLRRPSSLDKVRELVGDRPTNTQLAQLVRSPHREVRAAYLDAAVAAGRDLFRYVTEVDARLLPALTESNGLRELVVSSTGSRGRQMSLSQGAQRTLREWLCDDALVGDAVDLLCAFGCRTALRPLLDERVVAVVPDTELDRLAAIGHKGDGVDAVPVELSRRVCDPQRPLTVRQMLVERLAAAGDAQLTRATLLALRAEADGMAARGETFPDGSAPTKLTSAFASAVGLAGKVTAELRPLLFESATDPAARFALLDADCAPDTAADVVTAVLATGTELSTGQLDQVLTTVPLPTELQVGLLARHQRAEDLHWLRDGGANPVTDDVLVEVVAAHAEPHRLAGLGWGRPRVLDALIARVDGDSLELCHRIVSACPLDGRHRKALLARGGRSAFEQLLMDGRENPLTVELRDEMFAQPDRFATALVYSFTRLAPAPDELARLDADLFAAADREHAEGLPLDACGELLRSVELPDAVLTELVSTVPRLLGNYVGGMNPAGVRDEVLVAVAADAPSDVNPITALIVGARALEVPELRPWVAGLPAFVTGLQSASVKDKYPQALRLAWELLHEQLGDDEAAWTQVAARLDDWPGSLESLALTAQVTIA